MSQVAEFHQQWRTWFQGKGYIVVVMHECQWKTRVSGNPAIQDFVQKRHHPCEKYGRLNEGQLINMIKHGVVRSHFDEMTLIFKNTEVQ